MKKNLLNIYGEYKTDLYFATTFGFLIPIVYPIVDTFNQTIDFKMELYNMLTLILLLGYSLSNLIYFKTSRVRNLIMNFLGIVSYTFLAVPIFNLLTYAVNDKLNVTGTILCFIISFVLKIFKTLLEKKF